MLYSGVNTAISIEQVTCHCESLVLAKLQSVQEKLQGVHFQGLVTTRGMMEKVERFLFEKKGWTRFQKWAAIEAGSVSEELRKLLEPCEIRDLPGSSLQLMRNLSKFIHDLNIVREIKPPSYFGAQQKCFFEALS